MSSTANSKTAEQLERKNRWNSKRERERNQARYHIQQRLVRQVECGSGGTRDHPPRCPSSAEILVDKVDLALVAKYVEAVESGSVSSFSLRNLERHRYSLSRMIPVQHLHKYRYSEVSMSRFGERRRDELNNYFRPIEDGGVGRISILEYCALLGEFDCLKSLIVGGFDLVASDMMAANPDRYNHVVQKVSKRLLLDKTVPLTLSAYLVQAVVLMRLKGWGDKTTENEEYCRLCHQSQCVDAPFLCFGGGCSHIFCELCLWEDVIGNLDDRHSGDVMLCPVCGEPYTKSDGTASPSAVAEALPSDRLRISIERFRALPVDTTALRSLAKAKKISRRKTKKNTIHNNWLDATILTLGSSQEVRKDRYYRFVGTGDVHSVRCCLVAGVDVNMTNEYHQSALYLACWRGHVDIVRLLLDWGADPMIQANGGMSCYNALKANEVVNFDFSLFGEKWGKEPSPLLKDRLLLGDRGNIRNGSCDNNPAPTLTMLIHFNPVGGWHRNGPGGAFYVDDILPENILSKIDELFRSLPVDMSDKAIKQKKAKPCSKRSYFCDAEGCLQEALERAMGSVLRGDASEACPKDVVVFAQMRFLHYEEPSGWLAPHTDLSRTDPVTGKRSTHTFILYLTDSVSHGLEGGETALLASHTPGDTLARIDPKRGRLFLFPHACLHEGCEVISPPKIILRGEALLELSC